MKMKKIITAVLVASLSATSIVPAFATNSKQQTKQPTKTTQTAVKFEKAQAVQKVKNLILVYNEKTSSDTASIQEASIIAGTEYLDEDMFPLDVKTLDGKELNGRIGVASLAAYYDMRINKKQPKISIVDFIKKTNSDVLKKYVPEKYENYEALNFYLNGAVRIAPYLSEVKNIEFGALISDKNTAKLVGFQSAYSMTLTCDGIKNELKAYFDKDGNLITILPTQQNFDKFYATFTVEFEEEA